jgi:uncharacterized protein YggU (UPF0235/DUF167 family)
MAEAPLAALAEPGASFAVRVRPAARRNHLEATGTGLRAEVTAPAEGGKANRAVQRLLAEALGVAPTQLLLVRGARGRDKVFRLE